MDGSRRRRQDDAEPGAARRDAPAASIRRTRTAPTLLACAAALLLTAAGAAASVVDAIDSMRSEADECGLLIALCKIASRSTDRAESVPPSADFLRSRQSLNALARADEAAEAARAIERKHGRRLACFDDAACAGIVPAARRKP